MLHVKNSGIFVTSEVVDLDFVMIRNLFVKVSLRPHIDCD